MSEKIMVQASCGCFVGEPKWRYGSDWYKEPDECSWEDIIEVDKDEWDEESVSINCPNCNADLHQSDDHFDIVK